MNKIMNNLPYILVTAFGLFVAWAMWLIITLEHPKEPRSRFTPRFLAPAMLHCEGHPERQYFFGENVYECSTIIYESTLDK